MADKPDLLIGDVPGFTPQVARLVSMMTYARSSTLDAVAGLTIEQLDYLHDAQSNSIGALLAHIAATEIGYQAATLHGRDLNDEEKETWGATLALGERARHEIRGRELNVYVKSLAEVRALTLAEFAKRDDKWLDEEASLGDGRRANNYFKWFHVLGHEINHRGQIRWLKARARLTR